MATIINPTSLSVENIIQDLINYIESKPEYDSWRDFYESSAGMTAVELLAGLGSFLSYHSLGARRESNILTRKLTSSAIGLCNTLGYPVNRKSAPILRLKLNVGTSIYWSRGDAIGSYTDNRNLSILSSQTISAGIVYLDVLVGDWNTTTWVATSTDDFVILKIVHDNIDNNNDGDTIELLINDVPITIVSHAEDLIGSTVMLNTHQDGVLLIFGDGTLGRRLIVNDTVLFNYISTQGKLGVYTVEPTDIDINIDAEVQEVEVLSPGYGSDSLKKLSILPQGYYTTRRRMVTGPDHSFILQAYVGDLISSKYTKVEGECCTIRLSYLFNDEHLMTNNEVTNVLNYLDDYKMVGEAIEITDSELVGIDMKVTVVVDEGTTEAFVRDQINTIVDNSSWLLGTEFFIGAVSNDIASIAGINRFYIERPVSDKTLAYQQYLKLIHLDLVVTSDITTFISIDPSDEGYVKLVDSGTTDGVTVNKLIDSTAHFQTEGTTDGTTADKLVDSTADFVTDGIAIGDPVYNTTDDTKVYVTAIDDLNTLSLSEDIFISGEDYSIGVQIGDVVLNTTDTTRAVVTAVDSVTQLALDTDIFLSGKAYSIYAQIF